MAGSKITEREQAQAIKRDASLLITQQESVNGKEVETLLRAKLDTLLMALHGIGVPSPLVMCESTQPAQIWPEEGSPLRPVISILPAQTGSGDSSPENVRPISGRTAVTVTRTGKNLLDVGSAKPGYSSNVAIEAIDDGVRITGTNTTVDGTVYAYARWNSVPIESADMIGKTFTISARVSPSGGNIPRITVTVHDKNGTNIGTSVSREGSGDLSLDYTIRENEIGPGNKLIVVLYVFKPSAPHEAGTYTDYTNVQIELGSAATEYEPCRGDAYAISLGQTVYGGSVDWNRGELLVDTCGIVFNGTEDIKLQENYNNTGTNRFSYADTPVPVQESTALCSHMTFGYSPLGANNINNRIAVWKNGGLYWRFDRCATASEMKAYFTEQYNAGTPVKVVYALAEPYTVKLAPVTIPALAGLNTVTSTGEGMTLTYNKSLVREHEEIREQLDALPENVESTLEQMKADGVLVGIESIDVDEYTPPLTGAPEHKQITISTTDGKKTIFDIANGKNGKDGKDGATITGVDAIRHTGSDGVGYTAVSINVRESDDSAYEQMFMIKDGRTPAKGVDYWTDEDKKEINDYIASMVEQEVAKRLAAE